MSNDDSQKTKEQFEIELEGLISFLAYELDCQQGISFLHTEVPIALRVAALSMNWRGSARVCKDQQLESGSDMSGGLPLPKQAS